MSTAMRTAKSETVIGPIRRGSMRPVSKVKRTSIGMRLKRKRPMTPR